MEANEYIRMADHLFADMQLHAGIWDELRERVFPRSQANSGRTEPPDGSEKSKRFSTVAHESLLTLASAHLTYITPMGQRWFSFRSKLKGNNASSRIDDWFRKATETAYESLADSNFYTEIHEMYLDRCGFGTGCIFIEMTRDNRLSFKHIPVGTYAIAEGEDCSVDTLVRKFRLTAHQAMRQFGLDELPDKIKDAYGDSKKRFTDKFEFYQVVVPRESYKFGSEDLKPEERKWDDVYIALDGKKVVHRGGFYEFPFLVSRFLKWGDQPWGEAPGLSALEEIKGAVGLERLMDTLGQIAAFPRVLTLAEQVGEVDLRAGGKTVVSPQAAQLGLPKEWGTSGRYDVGMDRLERKEEKIRQAFFVPMLQIISSVDRQMTATEVHARQSEQFLVFTPSWTLFISDYRAAQHRIFSLLWRSGIFDREDAPEELFSLSSDGKKFEIVPPVVRYTGKIAQAMEQVQQYGLEAVIDSLLRIIQGTGDASILQAIDLYKVLLFLWDANGAPADCLLSEDEFEKKVGDKQQIAELQAALEEAMGALQKMQDDQSRQQQAVA